jgi:hypothetical protein
MFLLELWRSKDELSNEIQLNSSTAQQLNSSTAQQLSQGPFPEAPLLRGLSNSEPAIPPAISRYPSAFLLKPSK